MFTRLKTSLWVSALVRRAEVGGAYACIYQKGDPDAGAVLVKVSLLTGEAVLYRPMMDSSGQRVWLPKGPLLDRDIDTLIRRRVQDDPDLWAVEIEDKHGRHFLTEPIEE